MLNCYCYYRWFVKTGGGAKCIHNYHMHNNIIETSLYHLYIHMYTLLAGYTACTVVCTWYPSVTLTKHMPGPWGGCDIMHVSDFAVLELKYYNLLCKCMYLLPQLLNCHSIKNKYTFIYCCLFVFWLVFVCLFVCLFFVCML